MKKYPFIYILSILVILVCSCKKETFINSPDARVYFSADSIKFDTVFTSTGSITQSFKIFNDNGQKLLLSTVKLMGGSNSAFKINIDGLATGEANNITIAANDSIYVFVTVTVNPTSANLPFIISDSILINYNGIDRFVQLQAYGQNAHFLNNHLITTQTVWPNDLPYVILGSLRVDTTAGLTIDAGCRIFSHANAPFIVDGTLIINGNKGSEVVFASNRLDAPYKDFPAGWPGIYLRGSSKDNLINFAIVKNAYQAIVADGPSINSNPKLILQQCIIDNAYDAGITARNSNIQVNNSLLSNCGKNISISLGGTYTFTNCTVASFSNNYLLHKFPVLVVSNFEEQNGSMVTNNLNAVFRNCIFWGDNGNIEDELLISKQGTNSFTVLFDHSLYKAVNDPANATFNNVIRNVDPSFDSIDVVNRYYDFRTTKNPFAPGIDQGTATGLLKDLDNNNRSVGITDLGSYEKQ